MLRYHMAVITPDKRLKRAIKRVTTATASTAEFLAALDALSSEPPVDLAILDARDAEPSTKALDALPASAAISYIVQGEGLTRKIELLTDERVCSLFCHDDRFDDDEFIASATKALRRDVFGLQKYFPWGVTTYSMVVKNYEQKTRAIQIIMDYAREAGLRGPVRDRVQLVSDELMMNALYHAPVDQQGNERYRSISRKELASLEEVEPIEIHYGCSGRYFGISVRDGGGSLTRKKALEYLMRARQDTAVIENKATGAGLGLLSVLRSVSKLVFNLDPGSSTEVIALFDMDLIAEGKVGARSLHIFMAAPEREEEDDAAEEEALMAATQGLSGASKWAIAAIGTALLLVSGGIAYVMHASEPAKVSSSATSSTIAVMPTPTYATVTVNGQPVPAGEPFNLPLGVAAYEIVVTSPGHETWRQTLAPADVRGNDLRLYMTLDRSK
jgi:hypothetical protein